MRKVQRNRKEREKEEKEREREKTTRNPINLEEGDRKLSTRKKVAWIELAMLN